MTGLHFANRLAALAVAIVTILTPAAADDQPTFLAQGPNWDQASRATFYTLDQGSRMIPFGWMSALKQPGTDKPFLEASLDRYGYLPNPDSKFGLPVGFNVAGDVTAPWIGMTCAACHTRQINVGGTSYRADGGPAIVDFQSFLVDLDASVAGVLATDASFSVFAKAVLGPDNATNKAVKQLKSDVTAWYTRYHALIVGAMPKPSWGPGRLDAVSMIFDRLTGLDIGPSKDRIIKDNIKPADAPVRYPFIWNAPIQDWTQWPGFAKNGNDLLGLARNLGEVYGVFGDFEPRGVKIPGTRYKLIDYLHNNSADFKGLLELETLVRKMDAPKYPWPIDGVAADRGELIFKRDTDKGGCKECHIQREGEPRFQGETWATPVMNVGTDQHEYDILKRQVNTGVLAGALAIVDNKPTPLPQTAGAFSTLSVSVVGTILQKGLATGASKLADLSTQTNAQSDTKFELVKSAFASKLNAALKTNAQATAADFLDDLKSAFQDPFGPAEPPAPSGNPTKAPYAYESRVLKGIWATAPYLHDGSVPTLADLLEPVINRPTSFKIGPNYDIERLGMAKDQTKFGNQTLATGCGSTLGSGSINSGSSNCGHEYGTSLTADEKKDLLEYLKRL